MKRSNQLENLLVVSTLLTIMTYSFFYTSHAAAASSDSARPDALIQNSSKNSKNIHNDFNNINSNNNNNNNNTKPNVVSIQICDKSHPCKSGQSKGNLQ
jgi:hypothetical protein